MALGGVSTYGLGKELLGSAGYLISTVVTARYTKIDLKDALTISVIAEVLSRILFDVNKQPDLGYQPPLRLTVEELNWHGSLWLASSVGGLAVNWYRQRPIFNNLTNIFALSIIPNAVILMAKAAANYSS